MRILAWPEGEADNQEEKEKKGGKEEEKKEDVNPTSIIGPGRREDKTTMSIRLLKPHTHGFYHSG